ncbi:glycosylated lysosomal membrane protein [Eudromia elegans]
MGAAGRAQVSVQVNPGGGGAGVNVLHVRAAGPRDTLHYVWSSVGAPGALLVATRSPRSALRLDWSRLLSPAPAGAVWIEPRDSVVHASAVVFTKVFELRDAAGAQELPYPPYDLSRFTWGSVNETLNRTALTAEFRGVPAGEPHAAFANGSLAFRVTAYESGGRDEALPRLLHTANSSKLEFVLAGVAPRGNSSRFVLEVATVEEAGAARRLRSARSIDDEYAPTIFETLALAAEAPGAVLSFLQWKATAYGSRRPRREDGIRCRAQALRATNGTLPPSAIVRGYFGGRPAGACSVSALNVSFGGEDSDVYREKRYLSWSALLGFGQPPADAFSPLVVAIVAVVLGAPVALLLLGGLAVLLARRRRRSDYEPIN